MQGWFDSHIHLTAPAWTCSPRQLYTEAEAAGIRGMLVPGVRADDWPRLLGLAQELPGVYFAPGLHPLYAHQWMSSLAAELRELVQQPKVIALGEIGLDAAAGPGLKEQEKVFRAQLEMALDARLPVLLHSRKTTGRMLDILRELKIGEQVGGIWHGFSGSLEVARELVHRGFKIGVGPILLRESARKLPRALINLPKEALVLETDAPDMIDSPLGLLQVARTLAKIKGWTIEETARNCRDNISRAFPKIRI